MFCCVWALQAFVMKVKFLVIRFSSIGDIVLTSPVVRALKQQVPDAEVHFVTKDMYACLVADNPYVDKVHLLEDSMGSLLYQLERERFDYIIDLHQNFRSHQIRRRLKAKAFAVDKLGWQKMLLVWLKINRLPQQHIVDRYMQTVSELGVSDDGGGLDFFVCKKNEFGVDNLPEPFQKGYVAFVLAGTYATKQLPVEKVVDICRRIDFPVLLLGGKKELEMGEAVLRESKGNVLNYAGKITLTQSASLVRDARVVLTNDTGLMHIAAAFKKKILSFWGNTVPDFGMVPYRAHPASELVEVNGLKCRPCSKLGYDKCPKKHFECMLEIDTDRVVDWVERNF